MFKTQDKHQDHHKAKELSTQVLAIMEREKTRKEIMEELERYVIEMDNIRNDGSN